MRELSGARIALVHDWLLGMRGGERVLEELCHLFPSAPVYTFLHEPGSVSPAIEAHSIRTSLVDALPLARRHHRGLLPVLPFAAELLRIAPCDLVVSTSHCVAGSIRPPRGARHLSICFTPMRYLWGMEQPYLTRGLLRALYPLVAPPLRAWHRSTERRVDRFVAISRHVQARIASVFGRESDVVYPPVDVERFRPVGKAEDYFLIVSALVPYKRIDLAVDAFRMRSDELWIAGRGPELERLRRAAPPNVRFLGFVSDDELPGIVARARALLFPGEDEFGIAPVEAQAAGRPVVAFARGGALETVVPEGGGRPATGVLFAEQTPAALHAALERFSEREGQFDPLEIRAHARSFAPERFRESILGLCSRLLAQAPDRLREPAQGLRR